MSARSRPLVVAVVSAILGIGAVVRLTSDGETAQPRPPGGGVTRALVAAELAPPAGGGVGDPMTAPRLVRSIRRTRLASRRMRCAAGEVRMNLRYAPGTDAQPNTPEGALTRFAAIPLAAAMGDASFREIKRRPRLVRYRIVSPEGRPIGVARVGLARGTAWHVIALRACST